jgi:hypothetical protein
MRHSTQNYGGSESDCKLIGGDGHPRHPLLISSSGHNPEHRGGAAPAAPMPLRPPNPHAALMYAIAPIMPEFMW